MLSTAPLPDLAVKPIPTHVEIVDEPDEWDMPTFAFHDLDYIPSGYGGILAPYIETGPGTMRAAATLMRLNLPQSSNETSPKQVICDLGCGDGEFLIGLLTHLNRPTPPLPSSSATLALSSTKPPISTLRNHSTGFGIDYNPALIATATLNSVSAHQTSSWLVYDFNLDADDLFSKIQAKGVTHVFVYLVPKQLELKTVRRLLERLVEGGVCVCCHKFQPGYLEGRLRRRDVLMDLCVYERDE